MRGGDEGTHEFYVEGAGVEFWAVDFGIPTLRLYGWYQVLEERAD